MRQDDYEIIISCIQYGAPALYDRLIKSVNNVIESHNKLAELRRVEAEKARQATAQQPVEHEAEQLSLPLD